MRTQLEQLAKDAKPQKTYTVGASATLWMRNRVINMNVMQSVSSQNEVEATISRTRKRASAWLEDVYSTNGLDGKIPDMEAAMGYGVIETLKKLYSDSE